MTKATLLGAIAGALGLGLVASSAVAAPVGGVAQRIETASLVEKVHGRRYFRSGFFGFRPYHHFRRHHHFRSGFFGFRSSYHCHRRFCHRH
jgi:hypothetical protein